MTAQLSLVADTGSQIRSATDFKSYYPLLWMFPVSPVSDAMAATVLKTHLVAFSWARCGLQLALLNARILSNGLSESSMS